MQINSLHCKKLNSALEQNKPVSPVTPTELLWQKEGEKRAPKRAGEQLQWTVLQTIMSK